MKKRPVLVVVIVLVVLVAIIIALSTAASLFLGGEAAVPTLGGRQVMMSRAGAALRQQPLVELTKATGEHYAMESTRLNTCLQAFLRLSSEYRRYRALLENGDGARRAKPNETVPGFPDLPSPESILRHADRLEHDTDLHPDSQERMHFPEKPQLEQAKRFLRRAEHFAAVGNQLVTADLLDLASQLAPDLTAQLEKRVLSAYNPPVEKAPPETDPNKFLNRFKHL